MERCCPQSDMEKNALQSVTSAGLRLQCTSWGELFESALALSCFHGQNFIGKTCLSQVPLPLPGSVSHVYHSLCMTLKRKKSEFKNRRKFTLLSRSISPT